MLFLPDRTRQALLELAEQSDFLLFGELHGTQEVPQLITGLLDDLTALGYGGLGLEMSLAVQEPLMRWARSDSEAVPELFTLPPSDGTANEQVLALIRQVVESGWQVLCFDTNDDQPQATWRERDRTMADNLTAEWQRCCPGRKVVGVCGNLHSRWTPDPEPYRELWPSFVVCFQQGNPQCVIHTVNIQFHGGAFFNNGQVNVLQDDPLPEAELQDDPVFGHSYALHLPRATPPTFLSPPPE